MKQSWKSVKVKGCELLPGDLLCDELEEDVQYNEFYGALVVAKSPMSSASYALLDYDGTLIDDIRIFSTGTYYVHRKVSS